MFIKSSDGSSNYWAQFSRALVAELHANGLKVCAWQYVYGSNPSGEAELGAQAAAAGADCLVIDAEAEYEGRYAAAQTYITELRAKVGPSLSGRAGLLPLRLLPPLRALLGVPRARRRAVQRAADVLEGHRRLRRHRLRATPTSPTASTAARSSRSGRPTAASPPPTCCASARRPADYGATGLSFWDWQETSARGWATLAAPLAPLDGVTPNADYPELHSGSKGDQVLWLQEHLASAIPGQPTTGIFGAQTARQPARLPDRARASGERRRPTPPPGRRCSRCAPVPWTGPAGLPAPPPPARARRRPPRACAARARRRPPDYRPWSTEIPRLGAGPSPR